MFKDWISTYLKSLRPALVIKIESYSTKQNVRVYNAWFITNDNRYGLLSVIHDGANILGSMLPRKPMTLIGEEQEVRKYDLSKYLLLADKKEDLVLKDRFNKDSLETKLESILTDGAQSLCGLKFDNLYIRSVSIIDHFWRIALWDEKGLVDIITVDIFRPELDNRSLSVGMRILMEDALGGVFR